MAWNIVYAPFPGNIFITTQVGAIRSSGFAPTLTGSGNTTLVRPLTGQLAFAASAAQLPLAILTTSLNNGTQGVPYSFTMQAQNGAYPLTWSYSGTIPTGLSFSSAGVFSGTPTVIQTSTLGFLLTDALSNTATTSLTLQIQGPNPPQFLFPQTWPALSVGVPVLFTIPMVGGSGTYSSFGSSGLPNGLIYAGDGANNGLVSGTPTTARTFTPTLTVTDSAGNVGSETFTCIVS